MVGRQLILYMILLWDVWYVWYDMTTGRAGQRLATGSLDTRRWTEVEVEVEVELRCDAKHGLIMAGCLV